MTGKRDLTPRKDGSSSRKDKGPMAEAAELARPKRALQRSLLANEEAVGKVRYLAAAETNEWGATALRPGSTRSADLAVTEYPFFLHTLFAGLIPPFSSFFLAVLEHYQIHPLHLQPNSVTILSIFAFLCEAYVGVRPSVELLRCFHSLRISAGDQCSGCVSFRLHEAMASSIIPMKLDKKVENYRSRWLYVDTRQASPIFKAPDAPAVKRAGWEGTRIDEEVLVPLTQRMHDLRDAGLTGAMVAKEFTKRRIAPLQAHTNPMWTYSGAGDTMRLSRDDLRAEVVDGVMKVLNGPGTIADPSDNALPVYRYHEMDELIADMPRFDQWGLLPEGHVGERENPLMEDYDSSGGSETEDSQEASEPQGEGGNNLKRRRTQIVSSSDEDDDAGEALSGPREEEVAACDEAAGGSSSGPHEEIQADVAASPPKRRRKHWVARDE